jgi:hypothetical protein
LGPLARPSAISGSIPWLGVRLSTALLVQGVLLHIMEAEDEAMRAAYFTVLFILLFLLLCCTFYFAALFLCCVMYFSGWVSTAI